MLNVFVILPCSFQWNPRNKSLCATTNYGFSGSRCTASDPLFRACWKWMCINSLEGLISQGKWNSGGQRSPQSLSTVWPHDRPRDKSNLPTQQPALPKNRWLLIEYFHLSWQLGAEITILVPLESLWNGCCSRWYFFCFYQTSRCFLSSWETCAKNGGQISHALLVLYLHYHTAYTFHASPVFFPFIFFFIL